MSKSSGESNRESQSVNKQAKELDESKLSLFNNCNSVFVFEEVKGHLAIQEDRSLWLRLENEMKDGGVAAASTYLSSSFQQIVQKLRESISGLKESTGE